jgi:hypothetical protein
MGAESMPKGAGKTVYVSLEDQKAWDELMRYKGFYEDSTLSEFVVEKVKEELARMKAKYDNK